jgi:hypothetical protein
MSETVVIVVIIHRSWSRVGMANIHRCLGYIDIFQKNIDIFTSMLAFRYIVENIDVFVSIYLKISLITTAI